MVFLSLCSFILLRHQRAPYGRYSEFSSSLFGPRLPAKFAWLVQELPSFFVPLVYLIFWPPSSFVGKLLLFCFCCHYFNRTFIFSLRIRHGKPTRFIPFLLAFIFCSINGFLQASYLSIYFFFDASQWWSYLMLFIGLTLFFTGMAINIHSDGILRRLRSGSSTGHKIPHGGLFELVSAANFFGEIVEWIGFAVATGFSLPAVAFALFTFANIGPRGKHHHEDYLDKFSNYPKDRKAVIPFIW